jgi:Fe-S-cluster-containing dehydrogenase component
MDRRNFLKTMGIAGGTLFAKSVPLKANESKSPTKLKSILIDTTRCVGCRSCEEACASQNNLSEPDWDVDILETERRPSIDHFSVVNGYNTSKGEVYVKRQCMHCNQPACASACLTKAMTKTKEGPVIWQANKCMGCRYCMVACPFNVPQFEYNKPIPRIRKCSMCWERLKEGEIPACVENCPAEALKFGDRAELLQEAKTRIYQNPDQYVPHIYGEHEVGGTSFLYLSAVPFEEIGFPTNVGTTPPAEHTTGFLYSVPIILTLWPAFLLALNKSRANEESEDSYE